MILKLVRGVFVWAWLFCPASRLGLLQNPYGDVREQGNVYILLGFRFIPRDFTFFCSRENILSRVTEREHFDFALGFQWQISRHWFIPMFFTGPEK